MSTRNLLQVFNILFVYKWPIYQYNLLKQYNIQILGMLQGGYGATHVRALLAALNIPEISETSLKSREREVGKHLEEMAGQSCKEALQEEMKL